MGTMVSTSSPSRCTLLYRVRALAFGLAGSEPLGPGRREQVGLDQDPLVGQVGHHHAGGVGQPLDVVQLD